MRRKIEKKKERFGKESVKKINKVKNSLKELYGQRVKLKTGNGFRFNDIRSLKRFYFSNL